MSIDSIETLLILQGLLDYLDDPFCELKTDSMKTRVLNLIRMKSVDAQKFQHELDELIDSLLSGPDESAVREVLAAIPESPEQYRLGPGVSGHETKMIMSDISALTAGLETSLRDQTEEQELEYEVVPIFFATDRKPSGKLEPNRYFSGSRGELQFGFAEVSIPDRHRRGRLEQPPWYKPLVTKKPQRHVTLLGLNPLSEGAFVDNFRNAHAEAKIPQTLVFIHGYNVSFESAARRVAQICYDIQFKGIPFLYSWPSEARWYRYLVDEVNVGYTLANFRQCMSLIRSLHTTSVHMLAHSMGNRLLRDFMEGVSSDNTGRAANLGEIVMAAPDIDADVFCNTRSAAWTAAEHFTMYASSRDWALRLSKLLHGGYRRAGESGDGLLLVDGIDSIDASKVETGLFGHAYYGDAPSLLSDIHLLLHHRFRPNERPALARRSRGNKTYWDYLP